MTLTMEHVVTQLQKAQVAGQSGLADAVRAIKNLETFRVSFDVKSLGRPKEFSGKEEDFNGGRRRRRRSLLV